MALYCIVHNYLLNVYLIMKNCILLHRLKLWAIAVRRCWCSSSCIPPWSQKIIFTRVSLCHPCWSPPSRPSIRLSNKFLPLYCWRCACPCVLDNSIDGVWKNVGVGSKINCLTTWPTDCRKYEDILCMKPLSMSMQCSLKFTPVTLCNNGLTSISYVPSFYIHIYLFF